MVGSGNATIQMVAVATTLALVGVPAAMAQPSRTTHALPRAYTQPIGRYWPQLGDWQVVGTTLNPSSTTLACGIDTHVGEAGAGLSIFIVNDTIFIRDPRLPAMGPIPPVSIRIGSASLGEATAKMDDATHVTVSVDQSPSQSGLLLILKLNSRMTGRDSEKMLTVSFPLADYSLSLANVAEIIDRDMSSCREYADRVEPVVRRLRGERFAGDIGNDDSAVPDPRDMLPVPYDPVRDGPRISDTQCSAPLPRVPTRIVRPGQPGTTDLSFGPSQGGSLSPSASVQMEGVAVSTDWLNEVSAWWQRHGYYPPQAGINGEDGDVILHMRVKRDGHVEALELTGKSGSQWLDLAALSVFCSACLPPLPTNMTENEIPFQVTAHYIIVRELGPASPAGQGAHVPSPAVLSAAQRGAIGDHVRGCWTFDPGALGVEQMQVLLTVTTDAAGVARAAVVAGPDEPRLSDPIFREFAERARRAVLDPRCADMPLPPNLTGKTNVLTFRFSP
jgi:TonB family protein